MRKFKGKSLYEIWDEFGDFVNIFGRFAEAKREVKMLERINPNSRYEIIKRRRGIVC